MSSTNDSPGPLRLALLWHMHQPDYRLHDHLLLPWTRLHAIKDYHEMVEILRRHPQMHCTINFVPSLLRGLRGYGSEGWTDEVRELLLCPAERLSPREIDRLVYWAGLLPRRQLVDPFPRFAALLDRALDDRSGLNTAEVRDLQIWYGLSWTGEIARENAGLRRLTEQGSRFSEADREELCSLHDRIVAELPETLLAAAADGAVEFSTSPYYHPILPLLLDLDEAERAEPGVTLPGTSTGWVEDVDHQLRGARTTHEEWFEEVPTGCWPSEGSISPKTLDRLIASRFAWTASDETVLRRSRGTEATDVDHCFAWRWSSGEGEIVIFFRDHDLSDRIGFLYGDMDPVAAVDDFIAGVLDRRERIIATRGESAVAEAVLPVILDGENCWEWYRQNGRPFLEELYGRIVNHPLIDPVCLQDALPPKESTHRLDRLVPGSWIGGNFRIWIGGADENRAWELLAEARGQLMNHRDRIDDRKFYAAWEHLLAAEGSDWFWWYGSENSSANDPDFDELFRHRLAEIYRLIEMAPPDELARPLDSPTDATIAPERDDRPSTMHRASLDR